MLCIEYAYSDLIADFLILVIPKTIYWDKVPVFGVVVALYYHPT